MSAPSPVRGDVLERAVALRTLGREWRQIAATLTASLGKQITEDQVSGAVRRHNRAASVPDSRIENAPRPLPESRMVADPTRVPPQAPAVHTSKSRAEAYLLISDLQIPYHAPGALDFCRRVRFEFGVPLENVLCVGDEVDAYWGSRFEKSADAPHTAQQEIDEARKELARWAAVFPHMRLCNSNHGGRWARLASRQGIPRSMLRDYRELLGTPESWRWADHWIIPASKQRFRVEHGHWKPGGHAGLRNRPLYRGMSTAWGHEHAEPAVLHVDTWGQSVWGMRVGSLLSREPLPAFEYNTEDASRPVASVGVVLDGGRIPLIVRM